MSATATKVINHSRLQVPSKPNEFTLRAEAYGETMARELQASESGAYEAYSSLADNSMLEPWERIERRKAQVKKAREDRQARRDAYGKQAHKRSSKSVTAPLEITVSGVTLRYFVLDGIPWLLMYELFRLFKISQKKNQGLTLRIPSAHLRNVPDGIPGLHSRHLLITLEGAEFVAMLRDQLKPFNAVCSAIQPQPQHSESIQGLSKSSMPNMRLSLRSP